jgi:flavin reductase (DIM6/NTAB) family NADH-FMN oxidoreductase RutF
MEFLMSASWPETAEPQDNPPSLIGPDDLRRVFRRHAAAVAVITASHRGIPVGLLVTSLASVSASPPLISFNVARTSSSWPVLADAEHIGVHVLGVEQSGLADRFARKGADRFSPPTSWRPGPHGAPLIDGAAAWAEAVIEKRFEAGDHVIIVARLVHAATRDGADPLVHHNGEYRQLTESPIPTEDRSPVARFTVIRTETARETTGDRR